MEPSNSSPAARELLTGSSKPGKTAVFTNKHGPSSRRGFAAHLGIAGLLDGNFGATDTAWLKPSANSRACPFRTPRPGSHDRAGRRFAL